MEKVDDFVSDEEVINNSEDLNTNMDNSVDSTNLEISGDSSNENNINSDESGTEEFNTSTGMYDMDDMSYAESEDSDGGFKLSNNVILGIVIAVCVIVGIVLGIIFGKRAANK